MPELWLNYGSADVVLDIKAENLNILDNAKFKKLEEEIIKKGTNEQRNTINKVK